MQIELGRSDSVWLLGSWLGLPSVVPQAGRAPMHRFNNLGAADVKTLAVISPATMGPAYFREAAEVINAAAGGPPDRAKMMDVFRRIA